MGAYGRTRKCNLLLNTHMSLWHDKRGVTIRGVSSPAVILAKKITWGVTQAAQATTPVQGPCPDEINVALMSFKPLMMPNLAHTYWIKCTTSNWIKLPDQPVWFTIQHVTDLAAWATATEELGWIGRWMNPNSRTPREYAPPCINQVHAILANTLTERWRGIPI
jgi:hypothetical protein